jgi:hypothetical protein
MLGQPSKVQKGIKDNIDSKNLIEPLETRIHVSLKWKKHACGSGGVSIITLKRNKISLQ